MPALNNSCVFFNFAGMLAVKIVLHITIISCFPQINLFTDLGTETASYPSSELEDEPLTVGLNGSYHC